MRVNQDKQRGGNAMMRRSFGVFVGAVVLVTTAAGGAWAQMALTPAQPEEVGLSSQRLEKIALVFKQEIEQGKLPGAVVMIARKGRVAYHEAFGFQDKAKE